MLGTTTVPVKVERFTVQFRHVPQQQQLKAASLHGSQ